MKLPWINRHPDLDARGPLLGDGDDGQERVGVPPEQAARLREDGAVYPESFDEVRERHPWTPEAWENLDNICGSSMPDEMKIRLGTDVADFAAGHFFPGVSPQARNATHKKMEDLAQRCLHLEDILRSDQEVRSLRGGAFSDRLAGQLRILAGSARGLAGLKQAEKDNVKSMKMKSMKSKSTEGKSTRGNTLAEELLLIRLVRYFQASDARLTLTVDTEMGIPVGPFADFLRCIRRLLPENSVKANEDTFVGNGYDVARGVLYRQKADKRDE